MKISVSKATQSDAEVAHLAKNDLLKTHLKDFYYSIFKSVETVRELVSKLEANRILSSLHIDDVIAVFRDKICCEYFCLHFFEMDKLKGNTIDIELMLTELEEKSLI